MIELLQRYSDLGLSVSPNLPANIMELRAVMGLGGRAMLAFVETSTKKGADTGIAFLENGVVVRNDNRSLFMIDYRKLQGVVPQLQSEDKVLRLGEHLIKIEASTMRPAVIERLFRELAGLPVPSDSDMETAPPLVPSDINVSDVEFSGTHELSAKLLSNKVIQAPIATLVEAYTRYAMAQHLTSAIKVGPKAYPHIHKIVEHFAARCGLAAPVVYIVNDSALNACTLGDPKTYTILINSGLMEALTDAELAFVIGHEIGHIHGNHVVLGTLLRILHMPKGNSGFLGNTGYAGKAASIAFNLLSHLSLKDWERSAELTCDRYGLLCCEDRSASLQALAKVGTGIRSDFDIDGFISQMADIKDDWAARTMDVVNNLFASHPSTLRRMIALKLYSENMVAGRMQPKELDEKVTRIFLGTEFFMGDAEESYERLVIMSALYLHLADGFVSPTEHKNLTELAKSLSLSEASRAGIELALTQDVSIEDVPTMELTHSQKQHLARVMEAAVQASGSYSIEVDRRLVELWMRHQLPAELLSKSRTSLASLASPSMVVELLDRSHRV